MAKVKPLNDTQIKNAKSTGKVGGDWLADGDGLYLVITPIGSKIWKFRYFTPIQKARTTYTIGNYPDISLSEARQIRSECQALLAKEIDPNSHRQQQSQKKLTELNNTFEKVAQSWFEYRKTRANFSADYAKDTWRLIERNLLPHFGNLPITQVTAPMALKAFKPLQESGVLETLKRSIQKMNEIMNYALHRDIISSNPVANLSKEFDSPTVQHFKTIRPEDLSEFLMTLNTAQIKLQTRYLILWQYEAKHSDVDYMIEANKPSTKGKLISAQYYENPGHHDIKGGNQNTYNASKSVLPDNHLELWKKSIQTKDGDRWAKEVIDGKIIYHRFEYDRNFGTFHWNGSTAGKTQGGKERKIDLHNVPNEIKGR